MTLYTDLQSIVGAPMVLYTADAVLERVGAGVRITVTLSAETDGTIITGPAITAAVQCTLVTGASARAEQTIKAPSGVWSAENSPYTFTMVLLVPEIGTAKRLNLHIETYRSDAATAPGTHSFSTTLDIPSASAPTAPVLSASSPGNKVTSAVTLTVTNHTPTPGGVFGYTYQYRKYAGAWITFATTAEPSAVFKPGDYACVPGDTLSFRVMQYNTFGAAAVSDTVDYFVAQLPVAPTDLVADTPFVASGVTEIGFTMTDPGNPFMVGYLVETALDNSDLWTPYRVVPYTTFTVNPQEVLLTHGHSLRVRARTLDVYGQDSPWSNETVVQCYAKPNQIAKAYAVPKRSQYYNPVQVYWTPAAHALSYRIEYNIGGDWIFLADVPSGTYSYMHQTAMIAKICYRVLPIGIEGLTPDKGPTYTGVVDVYGVEGYYKQGVLLLKGSVYAIIGGESFPALQIVEV